MKSEPRGSWRAERLERWPWMTFLLPFVVFMVVGSLEPTPDRPGGGDIGLAIPYAWYPWLYTLKIALTVAAIAVVWPGYRSFPWRLRFGSLVVGVVGGALWIGLCRLDWEHQYLLPLLQRFGLGGLLGAGDRAAFNPLAQWAGRPGWAWTFLAVRTLGLVAVVPVIEEFFLRGFLMRVVMERDWQAVPFGRVNRLAVVVGTVAPMLMHPGELLAAAVWFSLVTWWMVRTRSLWDCVAVHAVTNLLLGVYVVVSGDWRLL